MAKDFACAPIHPNHLELGPLVAPDLNYLCVDGTAPDDSAAFAAGLESAGKKLKLRVVNLLDFLGKAPSGQMALPIAPAPDVQTFGTEGMRTLPVKGIDYAGKKRRILLPQGYVKPNTKTKFDDPALGPDGLATSKRNSSLMKVFLMAPGISDSDSENAYFGHGE